jgi:hypothetical protein
MKTSKTTFVLLTLLAAGTLASGCTDVGDNSASTGVDGGPGVDATTPEDAQTATDAAEDAAPGNGTDATVDSAGGDGVAPPEDAGVTGIEDAESPMESGTGTKDGSPAETGAPESGVDAAPDSSIEEAGVAESGVEAGVAESGTEAGSQEAGGGPSPCTHAPCAVTGANSVQCPDSPTSDGVCTPTEALIVARDITNGNLDSTGQLAAYVSATNNGSCYTCLNVKSCLDDDQMDTGNECADSPNVSGGPAACLTTLGCILSTDCQGAGGIAGTSDMTTQENVNLCYCGGNNPGSACAASGVVPDGLCDAHEAAGLGFALSDNTDILLNFGAKTLPSGIANHLFQCAASNKCTLCK